MPTQRLAPSLHRSHAESANVAPPPPPPAGMHRSQKQRGMYSEMLSQARARARASSRESAWSDEKRLSTRARPSRAIS